MTGHSVDALVDRSIDQIVETGLARLDEVIPGSPDDVARLEARYGTLPRAYGRFVRRAGGGAGRFLAGTDWRVNELLHALEVRAKVDAGPNAAWEQDEDALLIAIHQGYTGFYLANRDDDPRVMMFRESSATPTLWSDRFTTWLDDMVRAESEGWQQVDVARSARGGRGLSGWRRPLSRDIHRR
jgi:hypothetical protein